MGNNQELLNSIYDGQEDVIEVEEETEGQKVTTIEEAARYAYALSQTRESIRELEEIAQKEIEKWQNKISQVQNWLEDATKSLKNKEEYLSTQLRIFHITQYNSAKNEKEKKKLNSIKLPYDITLKSRAQADKYVVSDETAYKDYARENDLIKIKEEVDWANLKKKIVVNSEGKAINKETGEFLDFIKVVPQERKFEVN